MRRPAPPLHTVLVLVVALLALVVPATGVIGPGGGGPADATLANRTNTSDVLQLPRTNRSEIDRPELDLSTALSIQWASGRASLDRTTLRRRVAAADTPAGRQRVLDAALDRTADRLDGLLREERAARGAYLRAEINTDRYLARLGTLQAGADEVAATLEVVTQLVADSRLEAPQELTDRVLRAEARLAVLRGPLRAELTATVTGRAPPSWLYVGVADEGVTLAAVRDEEFVHETARLDGFSDAPSDGSSGVDAAIERWAAVYPTVWDPGRVDFTGLNGAYRAALPFDGGRLVSHLDANTLQVYREVQYKTVPGVPTVEAGSEVDDDLRLAVNRSFVGGPLQVRFGEVGGEGLDGVVRVNGVRVGRTGIDGRVWAVAPAGQFTVTVDYGDRQLTLVVEPV